MKKIYNSKNAGKLAAYSAMAGAFIAAGAKEANATIVYTDIDDVTLNLGDATLLDMDGDGTNDFVFVLASNTAGNWSFAQVIGYWSAYSYGAPSNQVIGYSGSFLPYGSALNNGDNIGASANFISNTYNLVFLASIYSGNTYGPFANVSDKYMGVKFQIGSGVHYGWVRLDGSVGPVTITIKDMAYEDVEDATIEAGATTGGTVAVANLTDAQVSAYSYGNTINVNLKNTTDVQSVNVYDLNGNVVYAGQINGSHTAFSLNNVATGIYSVQLLDNNGNAVYGKNMFIQN